MPVTDVAGIFDALRYFVKDPDISLLRKNK